jgi:hypothetical protein
MNLSYNHPSNKLKFVSSNISEVLKLALSLHAGNTNVFEFAFGAIVNLTDTEDSSIADGASPDVSAGPLSSVNIVSHFSNSNICDLIIENLPLFLDDSNDTVIELGLWAIKNIALFYRHSSQTPSQSQSLSQSYEDDLFDNINTCHVICQCLSAKMTTSSSSVIEMACWIIKILSQNNISISFKFGTVGICNQIITALQMHCNNETLIEIGCATIQSLCLLCDTNRRIFVNLDAYSLITKLIKQHYSNEIIESIGWSWGRGRGRHKVEIFIIWKFACELFFTWRRMGRQRQTRLRCG